MPTAAVFIGAGLLELSDEPSESESLESEPLVLVDEEAELVRVLTPLAFLLAVPEARPVAVAWAPVALPTREPAPAVTEATAPEAPEMRPETWDAAPEAPAPTSEVRLDAREPAWPARESMAEGAPPRALVTWLAAESRPAAAVSRGSLGSMADSTFEIAAPRSWACVWGVLR